ncbi:MAG: hypothetical protein U0984_09900, partial [Prosthecobacter sp.]|nr:hypothetical protein [Prosthecobacter sp.]
MEPTFPANVNRRNFLQAGAGAVLSTAWLQTMAAGTEAVDLPKEHCEMMQRRRRRIVVQYDANDTMWSFWKAHKNGDARFDRFRDAVFAFPDEPGS